MLFKDTQKNGFYNIWWMVGKTGKRHNCVLIANDMYPQGKKTDGRLTFLAMGRFCETTLAGFEKVQKL